MGYLVAMLIGIVITIVLTIVHLSTEAFPLWAPVVTGVISLIMFVKMMSYILQKLEFLLDVLSEISDKVRALETQNRRK